MVERDEIMRMIGERTLRPGAATDGADLYADLGLDSLTFAGLIVDIEAALGITFGIAEMHGCAHVGDLIRAAEKKRLEAGRFHA